MGQVVALFGDKGEYMKPLNNTPPYAVGTVVMKRLSSRELKFVVVSGEIAPLELGQKCIATNLTMQSMVRSSDDKEKGGIGIGSFRVLEDEKYWPHQVAELYKDCK